MQKHDIGQTMMKTLGCLVKDAHAALGSDVFRGLQKFVAANDVNAVRNYVFPDTLNASPYIVKWTCQIEGWLKRFRFTNDVFTQEELEDITIKKFDDTQIRLPSSRPESSSCYMVLQEARKIVKEILGKYDSEEHMQCCRFGSKSAKGIPMKRSYLDLRVEVLSGSCEHVKWFKTTYLPSDRLLAKALLLGSMKNRPRYVTCKSLDLFNVPKSWKSLRSIMPNTVIGNFYSNGMGDLIAARLKENLFDISRMQEKHKKLAQLASMDRRHVTADLSSASDSFTSWLVNVLVPRDWLRALKLGRITDCEIGDRTVKLQSFMTMGIGFTFPLQTLLFYSIIRAVGRLLNVAGTYSVYGDDLIYPRKIHKYVEATLNSCGFLLNKDKTYVSSFYRESCGGDYFRGVDVRPCSPSGQHHRVGRQEYCAFLYKLANGLLRRWDSAEIPATMYFLIKELVATNFRVLQVPPYYPESSGLRVDTPIRSMYFERVFWSYSKQAFTFSFLEEVPRKRVVKRQPMYFWDSLRVPFKEVDYLVDYVHNVTSSEHPLQAFVEKFLRLKRKTEYVRPTRERIAWRKVRPQPANYRSKITGLIIKLTEPTVSMIHANHLVRQTGQSSSWT